MRLRLKFGRGIQRGVLVLVALWGTDAALPAMAATQHSKKHPLRIEAGVLTVDGLTARHGLTLRTTSFRYLYLYLPGEGTAIVAEQPFEGAHEQKAAFHEKTLTVLAGGRHIQLTSTARLRNHSAFVRFERGTVAGLRTPAVALGEAALVPAIWPGEDRPAADGPFHFRVHGRRALRTGRLCRPSPHGRELCAVVREVVYKP